MFRAFWRTSHVLMLVWVIPASVLAQNCITRTTLKDGELTPPGGPTVRASLRDGQGFVSFPASVADPQAQVFLDQGLAQWHSGNPVEAERSFRQVARLDPECPLAYWGMALSCLDSDESRALRLIQTAVYLKAHRRVLSRCEARHIEALAAYLDHGQSDDAERRQALVEAYDAILADDPEEIEAAAMLARQLASNRQAGLPGVSVSATDALLARVLSANPKHPARWTRLRLWENRPEVVLNEAIRCGPSAPASPAMWAEPARLFSSVGRWSEAIRLREAAERAYLAQSAQVGVHPDRYPGHAENAEAWVRDLERVGRVREALVRASQMRDLPRHPRFNMIGNPESSASRGQRLLVEILARYDRWDELTETLRKDSQSGTAGPIDQIRRLRYLGRAHFAQRDDANGRAVLSELELLAERLDGADQAAATLALHELAGRSALASGEVDRGLDCLKQADLDPIDMARALDQAGRVDEALNALTELAEERPGEPLPLALLADLRRRTGRLQEAEQTFLDLRACSGSVDLDAPPFASIAELARTLGYPSDWRLTSARLASGDPFPIESLGPDRWTPSPSPETTLIDAQGQEHHLGQPGGKPTIVIFYLGAGCLHCSQQLAAFGPETGAFQAAGIDLLGVSTDDAEALAISIENYGVESFPFPLASDKPLDAFRKFRAYDEFLETPLHGTFLIDGSGRILWSDTGDEPFMDPEFLLRESVRLLTQSSSVTPSSETSQASSNP